MRATIEDVQADIGYVAAFAGGVVSFLSPCVLPIVPAYLSLIGGVSIAELKQGSGAVRARIVRDTALFVSGFSLVFVILGLSVTALGRSVAINQSTLTTISGVLLLAMASLLFASQLATTRWVQMEHRFHPPISKLGPFAAPVAGVAFGFGWTPCIGPVLASVLAVAGSRSSLAQGTALLVSYALGLGLPFLIAGIAFGRLAGAFDSIRRHLHFINIVAAGVLATFGMLLILGRFSVLTARLSELLRAIGLDGLISLG